MSHVRFHGAMRPKRQRDHVYRTRQRNGAHVTDWLILAMFLGTCLWLWWGPLNSWWDALMGVL
jgi:hypothetical protein